MKKSVFIVSKPLQYINASNIEDENIKDCIIIDTFYSADKFRAIVEAQTDTWASVKLCKDTYEAVKYVIKNKAQYDKLYIDSDFGIVLSFYFNFLGSIKIYTYEEGYASYTFIRNGNTILAKFKEMVAKVLGLKNWVGGHAKTRGMYLYQPAKFIANIGEQKDKEILSFKQPFSTHLTSLKEITVLFDAINFSDFKGKDIILYMTNYYINPKAILLLESYPGYLKVIKPHPQISKVLEIFSKFDLVIENHLPAEILIEKLLTQCNSLIIMHEGSFALEYFENNEKMMEIPLAK